MWTNNEVFPELQQKQDKGYFWLAADVKKQLSLSHDVTTNVNGETLTCFWNALEERCAMALDANSARDEIMILFSCVFSMKERMDASAFSYGTHAVVEQLSSMDNGDDDELGCCTHNALK